MKNIHFYDLDGCLLDSSHRYRILPGEKNSIQAKKIDLNHWRANEHLAHLDTPIQKMVEQFKKDMLDVNILTAISTNRYYCTKTKDVLFNAGIEPDFVSSRVSDFQSSASIKEIFMYSLMQELRVYNAVFFDDNKRIIKDVKKYFRGLFGYDMLTIHIPSNQGH